MEMAFSNMQTHLMITTNPANLTRSLVSKFQRSLARGQFSRLVSTLTGRSNAIFSLEKTIKDHPVSSRHYAGLRSIALQQIRGTEARSTDFDRSFNPLSNRTISRWLSVARARLSGVPLPPVDLIEINGEFFVRDGHHRVSVARALGEDYIEAEVTVWEVADQVQHSLPTVSAYC